MNVKAKIFGILSVSALSLLVFVPSAANADPIADPPIETIGGYNFVSTSADGSITAAYSGATGLSVYRSATHSVASYTATYLAMTSVGEAVVSPDGSEIYLVGADPHEVAVFNTQSESVTRRISLPFAGWMGAATPDGASLLVFSKTTEQLVKITLASDTVSSPLDLGFSYPYQLCVTSDSSTVYLPGYDVGYTSVVNIPNMNETAQLADDQGPIACALDASNTLYVGDYISGGIRKYASDGSNIQSVGGLAEEMFGIGLTCNSVVIGDYQNTGYVTLNRETLAQTGHIDSEVYTYMMSVDASASTTWVGGWSSAAGLQQITESSCPTPEPTPTADPALASTGFDGSVAVTAFGISLVGLAMIAIRRRRSS